MPSATCTAATPCWPRRMTQIAADLAARPVADHRIIHVGDYIDRGPDSAGVIDAAGADDGEPTTASSALAAITTRCSPASSPTRTATGRSGSTMAATRRCGPTASRRAARCFGPRLSPTCRAACRSAARRPSRLPRRPAAHRPLRRLPVRPRRHPAGRAARRSRIREDLIWIREDFLWDGSDHGVVVVHGHTPAHAPEVHAEPHQHRHRRGLWRPAHLLALEGTDYRFL